LVFDRLNDVDAVKLEMRGGSQQMTVIGMDGPKTITARASQVD